MGNGPGTRKLDKPQLRTWTSHGGLWLPLRSQISCKLRLGTLLTAARSARTRSKWPRNYRIHASSLLPQGGPRTGSASVQSTAVTGSQIRGSPNLSKRRCYCGVQPGDHGDEDLSRGPVGDEAGAASGQGRPRHGGVTGRGPTGAGVPPPVPTHTTTGYAPLPSPARTRRPPLVAHIRPPGSGPRRIWVRGVRRAREA